MLVVVVLVDVAVVENEVEVVVDVVERVVVIVGKNVVLVESDGVVIVATPIEPAAGEFGDERMPTKAASTTKRSVSSFLANLNSQAS